jgi:hypothetical protein
MANMKDGFKRGTNYCHRMAMENRGQATLADLAVTATVIRPSDRCGRCAHDASDHDLDRIGLLAGQRAGGEGCLHGWTGDGSGCACEEFVPAIASGATVR